MHGDDPCRIVARGQQHAVDQILKGDDMALCQKAQAGAGMHHGKLIPNGKGGFLAAVFKRGKSREQLCQACGRNEKIGGFFIQRRFCFQAIQPGARSAQLRKSKGFLGGGPGGARRGGGNLFGCDFLRLALLCLPVRQNRLRLPAAGAERACKKAKGKAERKQL